MSEQQNKMQSFNLFPHKKNSAIIYNHFNEGVINKIRKELKEFDITMHKTKLDEDEFFILTYNEEAAGNTFLNHLKKVINHVLQNLKIHLISAEFEDVVGIVTHIDKKRMKPLGLHIQNVPFLDTNIQGEFTAHPKTVDECYEVLTICHDNKKFNLVNAEFGYQGEKSSLIITIEKIERIPVIHSKITNQVLL